MSIARLQRGFAGERALGAPWLVAFIVLGCGSAGSGGGASAGSGGQTAAESGQAGVGGGEASQGGAADGGRAGDAGASAVLDAPWDEHGQHVDLGCFAYFSGSMEFGADRAELSAEQLQLLAGLRQIRPNDECYADDLGCGSTRSAVNSRWKTSNCWAQMPRSRSPSVRPSPTPARGAPASHWTSRSKRQPWPIWSSARRRRSTLATST